MSLVALPSICHCYLFEMLVSVVVSMFCDVQVRLQSHARTMHLGLRCMAFTSTLPLQYGRPHLYFSLLLYFERESMSRGGAEREGEKENTK